MSRNGLLGYITRRKAGKMAGVIRDTGPVSRKEMVKRIQAAGFEQEDAIAAAKGCRINWQSQAVAIARQMVESQKMPPEALKQALIDQGFSGREAEFATKKAMGDRS